MQVRNGELPCARQLARIGKELSREARARLDWMDYHRRCRNVALTCRHFGISRQIFYRWQKRYDPYNLATLQSRLHRPHLAVSPPRRRPWPNAFWICVASSPAGAKTSWRFCSTANNLRFRSPWWAAFSAN
jgi:hypothetical protein